MSARVCEHGPMYMGVKWGVRIPIPIFSNNHVERIVMTIRILGKDAENMELLQSVSETDCF